VPPKSGRGGVVYASVMQEQQSVVGDAGTCIHHDDTMLEASWGNVRCHPMITISDHAFSDSSLAEQTNPTNG
jgi:hypothetical protein